MQTIEKLDVKNGRIIFFHSAKNYLLNLFKILILKYPVRLPKQLKDEGIYYDRHNYFFNY